MGSTGGAAGGGSGSGSGGDAGSGRGTALVGGPEGVSSHHRHHNGNNTCTNNGNSNSNSVSTSTIVHGSCPWRIACEQGLNQELPHLALVSADPPLPGDETIGGA